MIDFDALIERADAASLDAAISLYRGDLLSECDAEWVMREREWRRERFLSALETLAERAEKGGDLAESIRMLRRAVEADPFRENAHRKLMAALGLAGDYVGVERQFRDLRRMLLDELNIEPAQETIELHRHLMLSSRARQSAPAPPAPKRRLPRPLTALVGRDDSIEEIGTLLRSERLVTLAGAGGIGKTRLALATAEATSEFWEGGVWWGDLASLAESRHLVPALLRTFGLDDSGNASPLDTMTGYLRERHALLILDNCEHLVSACAELSDHLLRECDELRILTTSREPLNIVGERVWRVPALTVPTLPQTGASNVVESVCNSEAAQLFAARAHSVSGEFCITAENSEAIARICRTLDGIPLAIELAAVWVRSLSVEQISGRLMESFSLLAHGNRSAPMRHQTLQMLIEWSEKLLAPDEHELLAKLAVFSGGWTLEAAESICGSETGESADIAQALNRLVEQSLVEAEQNGGEMRFRFLETVRQFAAGRLQLREDSVRLRERHRHYYLALAESLCSRLGKADSPALLDLLERERDNFHAALATSRADKDPTDIELRLGTHLHRFFNIRGSLNEGIQVLKSGLENRLASPAVRAEGLLALGQLYCRMDENFTAKALFEEALAIFRELALPQREAETMRQLGTAVLSLDDYSRARVILLETVELSRRIGFRFEEARATSVLGIIAKNEGDTPNAISLFARANQIMDEIGDVESNGIILHNWGNALREQGDWRQARKFYERSLAIHRLLGKRTWIGFNLYELAVCWQKEKDVEQMRLLYDELAAFSQNINDQTSHIRSLAMYIALLDNKLDKAREYLLQSFTMGLRKGERRNITYYYLGAADIAITERKREQAVRFISISCKQREAMNAPFAAGDREELEEKMALLRSELGSESFEAEWRTGHETPDEEALSAIRVFCIC